MYSDFQLSTVEETRLHFAHANNLLYDITYGMLEDDQFTQAFENFRNESEHLLSVMMRVTGKGREDTVEDYIDIVQSAIKQNDFIRQYEKGIEALAS